METWWLSIADMADLISSRKASPVEIVSELLARIERIDPKVNAFITVTAELAMQQARKAETEISAGKWRGPLHGIPFGLKDMFNTAGILTTANSRALANNVPASDATVVKRLYDAGAVLLGKLATSEFAHGGPSFDLPWPSPRNPWNTDHFTGGSSSGSAAAVAAGLVPMALGTDTGGSIRIPAWMCGNVGLKPTFGRVSRAGVIPFSESCDHVGSITRTVRDAAIVLRTLEESDPPGTTSGTVSLSAPASLHPNLKGMKLGFVRHFSERDLDVNGELRSAVEDALQVFRSAGATVDDVTLRPVSAYYPIRLVITECDAFSLHLEQFRRDPSIYGHHFLARCLPAVLFQASDYIAAQRERSKVIWELDQVFRDYDALITVGGGPAPVLSESRETGAEAWSSPSAGALIGALASLTGVPALAQCCGYSSNGLPLGMQILGRPWEDEVILNIAQVYEDNTGWGARRPPVDRRPLNHAKIEVRHEPVGNRDEDLRPCVATAVRNAGLKLDPRLFDLVLDAAPHLRELARMIPAASPYVDGAAAMVESFASSNRIEL